MTVHVNRARKGYMDLTKYNGKEHALGIINWLLEEVISSGGDGDGIWYSKYFSCESIYNFILENIDEIKYIEHMTMNMEYDRIIIFDNQESLEITNREESFTERPNWQQVSLVW
jgi:hypothetical protein